MRISSDSFGRFFIVTVTLLVTYAEIRAADLPGEIAATVDGHPIYVRQVERVVDQAIGTRQTTEQTQTALRREALTRLIDRSAIIQYLRQQKAVASENEIDAAIEELTQDLARRNKTLAAYLEENQITLKMLRDEFLWQVTWTRQLDKYLTDSNLERYFNQHQRRFAGTEVQVAQILLKTGNAPAEHGDGVETLRKLRTEILAGKTTFADAAQRISDAASGADGGRIGWIGSDGPMPPKFTDAAFGLKVGEVSAPVVTSAGVHLIKCLAERPGKKNWKDVRPALRSAVAQYLFRWLAERARAKCKIDQMLFGPAVRSET